ncbi:hypothetical protein FHU10_0056 [Serratia fonticola]|jgi:hypothetical protein|uniref:Uncharacterized protein n=1 Tax=Serratia fonticola TaxID=47917 RepID=A0A542D4X1_SERFO|nr:hypothetical protein FHU09_2393 [Serratia fonticola]TQI98133.1 hypothetical protein FHU11_3654 [Serratia fonticola]TVZ67661.1 hypothetical protein FHU10_0056 [Serratia fonticola]
MMVVELNACHVISLYIEPASAELLIKLNYPLYNMQPFFGVINLIY